MEITQELVGKIIANHLTLESYFILDCISKNNNWYIALGINTIKNMQRLRRLGYLNESNQLTKAGSDLLEVPYSIEVDIVGEDKFEEFWNKFPRTDKWQLGEETRVLRFNKKKAIELFEKAINDGHKADIIIKALEKDINMKQKDSGRENKMKYMPNICAWLNQRVFESFKEDNEITPRNNLKFGEDIE